MIWRTKPTPKIGDERRRRAFAWLPVACSDGYTRWLEHVIAVQEYQPGPLCNWLPAKYEAIPDPREIVPPSGPPQGPAPGPPSTPPPRLLREADFCSKCGGIYGRSCLC